MAALKKQNSQLADRNDFPLIGNAQTLLADLVAITGGESPTEAEHNLVVTKVNAILDILEEHGLMKAT
jgi:hypothetical protein